MCVPAPVLSLIFRMLTSEYARQVLLATLNLGTAFQTWIWITQICDQCVREIRSCQLRQER